MVEPLLFQNNNLMSLTHQDFKILIKMSADRRESTQIAATTINQKSAKRLSSLFTV